jgi:hypothetical protein
MDASEYYEDYGEPEPAHVERPRDNKIDEARDVLLTEVFGAQPQRVFYERQIEVLYERRFFHWITRRALGELAGEGKIGSELLPLIHPINLRFYWSRKLRYWRREAEVIRALVARYSSQDFTRGLGRQGEMLFDAALPTGGFMPKAKNVREYGDRRWTVTDHNLDRVFEKDAIAYGVEVKNTLVYISRQELGIKLAICEHLGLRPLFVVRAAPKSYIHQVNAAGGYVVVFRWQLYPFGQEALAEEVRDRLGLPVDCPQAIQAGTVQRLVNWHDRHTLYRA